MFLEERLGLGYLIAFDPDYVALYQSRHDQSLLYLTFET
jgi:hypothetical protein